MLKFHSFKTEAQTCWIVCTTDSIHRDQNCILNQAVNMFLNTGGLGISSWKSEGIDCPLELSG